MTPTAGLPVQERGISGLPPEHSGADHGALGIDILSARLQIMLRISFLGTLLVLQRYNTGLQKSWTSYSCRAGGHYSTTREAEDPATDPAEYTPLSYSHNYEATLIYLGALVITLSRSVCDMCARGL